MKLTTALFLVLCSMIIIASCTHPISVPPTPTVSFAKDVLPIFIGNCDQTNCHSGVKRRAALNNYNTIMTYGSISPYNALGSKIYKDMSARGLLSKQMPPTGPIAEGDLQTVFLWIQQGAKNN